MYISYGDISLWGSVASAGQGKCRPGRLGDRGCGNEGMQGRVRAMNVLWWRSWWLSPCTWMAPKGTCRVTCAHPQSSPRSPLSPHLLLPSPSPPTRPMHSVSDLTTYTRKAQGVVPPPLVVSFFGNSTDRSIFIKASDGRVHPQLS